ncbi:MAG: metal ABC transporter substrate-binding protein, partial [Sulfurovum sp.]|nr:metal ABC transporter substrate-binding protein [Sulfurovum sp.]
IQYHQLFNYVLHANNIESIGNIEPLPGIAPSSKHTLELIQNMKDQGVKTILQDVYHERKTAQFIAEHTGAKVVLIPHDVGAVEGTDTLEDLYKTIASRLCP